jgi:DNA repair photolyase
MKTAALHLPLQAPPLDGLFSELFPQAGSESAEIFVRRVQKALERGEEIVLGSPAVPYAEAGSPRLLALLAPLLAGTPGSAVTLLVRSPRILREADVLTEIDRGHGVTVQVLLPTVDPRLAARLEGEGSADLQERLRTVAELAERGIATAVLCAPFHPQVHASERVLRPLFQQAVAAGAFDVAAAPGTGWRRTPIADQIWRQLRLEHGLPRPVVGRA